MRSSGQGVPELEAWLRAVVETPGLTSLALPAAREALLDDALRAAPLLADAPGPVVDVGSGNGTPGIPLAHAFPDKEFVLLEAELRRCAFLEAWSPANARVVRGRVEEQATDWAGASLAKALAPPPVAVEWCLPLLRPGGLAILWVGENVELAGLVPVAARLNAEPIEAPTGFAVFRKSGPTPAGFPRRTGVARKRPLS
ncbi:MAG TPA: RsmG family class I SAM-dependent methyltransferase [Gaiellaceae bacterium]|nr:RsmG family class I SAM-dependent methyltransferase [Gaiellaceae bacterium]